MGAAEGLQLLMNARRSRRERQSPREAHVALTWVPECVRARVCPAHPLTRALGPRDE